MCFTGLMYQTSQLITQFISGKTVVNLEVRRINTDSIPAITLCLPQGISMKRIAEYETNFTGLYETYTKSIERVSEFPRKMNATDLENEVRRIKDITQIMMSYKELYARPVAQIMSDLSIPFINEGKPVVYIKVMGIIENSTDYTSFKFDEMDQEPIESLVADLSGYLKKCFTFFSALSLKWRHFKVNLHKINIGVRHRNEWYPGIHFNRYHLSVHSPNSLPDFRADEHFTELLPNKEYSITYSQINTELLGSGYDTNCKDYELDHKFANLSMRSDCISSCYLTKIKQICDTTKVPSSMLLLRKQFLELNGEEELLMEEQDMSLLAFCIDEDKEFETQLECSSNCKYDCKLNHYSWDLKVMNEWMKKEQWLKMGRIHMKHNRMPDVIVRHIPETSFITFVCSFGGLLGMWLGLSVLLIFDKTFSFVNKQVRSRLTSRSLSRKSRRQVIVKKY